MPEIESMIYKISNKKINILMVPHLLPVTRGIMSNIYIKSSKVVDIKKTFKLFDEFYSKSYFVKVYKKSLNPTEVGYLYNNHCPKASCPWGQLSGG